MRISIPGEIKMIVGVLSLKRSFRQLEFFQITEGKLRHLDRLYRS